MTPSEIDAVQLTLPRPRAARLLVLLRNYEAELNADTPGWMTDDELLDRGNEAEELRAMQALLAPQIDQS